MHTDIEDTVGGFLLWGFFLLICIVCMIYSVVSHASELTDWQRAYQYVRQNPKVEVRLFIKGLSTPNGESVTVYIQDGETKYKVGSVAFYLFNKSNFVLDLTSTLLAMKELPSKNTKIVLQAKDNVKVKYERISITPVFVSRGPS